MTVERSTKAAEDIAYIYEVMGRLRLMIGRQGISRTLINELNLDLQNSHMETLMAMSRLEGEVTVGSIAGAMRLDPSRASRLVAEMVAIGLLRRRASQTDGRRSIIVRTDSCDQLLAEVNAAERKLFSFMLYGWSDEEVSVFTMLLKKFISEVEETYHDGKTYR